MCLGRAPAVGNENGGEGRCLVRCLRGVGGGTRVFVGSGKGRGRLKVGMGIGIGDNEWNR